MQSRLLRHFLTVYQHMNITAAAAALNVTQPALTKSIKLLEGDLGTELFQRLPNGVVPTLAGESLARRAVTIFKEYEHALADIDALKGGGVGSVRVGAGPIWLTQFVPAALPAFRRSYPLVRVFIEGGVVSTLVPALLRGEIDVLCGALDFPDHPDIEKREIDTIQHVVIASRYHPLAKAVDRTALDLLSYPWAMLARDEVGQRALAAYFAGEGLSAPGAALETSSIGCLLETLRQGELIACLPRRFLGRPQTAELVEVPVSGSIWHYRGGIATRRRPRPTPIVRSLVEVIAGAYFVNLRPV